ncbi:MAG: VCBS repeat-containing protein [Myxococcota bacterium]
MSVSGTNTYIATIEAVDPSGQIARQRVQVEVSDVVVPFLATSTSTLGPSTHFLEVGDIDGDGHLDAVELTATSLRLHVGGGDGTFTWTSSTSITPAEPGYGAALAVGDFDGVGGDDVARSSSGMEVETWLSMGRSGFRRSGVSSSRGPTLLKAGHYDGDSYLDLLGFSWFDWEVTLLTGDGLGSFNQTWTGFISPFVSNDFGAGDVSGDGLVDFAVAGSSLLRVMGEWDYFGAVTVWITSSTDRPQIVTLLDDWPRFASAMVLGDFNEDGRDDIVATGVDLVYLESLGGGNFAAPALLTPSSTGALLSADVNADGHLDLIEYSGTPSIVRVYHGGGDGTFGPARTSTISIQAFGVRLGDADEDGLLDLILLREGGVEFARGTGE